MVTIILGGILGKRNERTNLEGLRELIGSASCNLKVIDHGSSQTNEEVKELAGQGSTPRDVIIRG